MQITDGAIASMSFHSTGGHSGLSAMTMITITVMSPTLILSTVEQMNIKNSESRRSLPHRGLSFGVPRAGLGNSESESTILDHMTRQRVNTTPPPPRLVLRLCCPLPPVTQMVGLCVTQPTSLFH